MARAIMIAWMLSMVFMFKACDKREREIRKLRLALIDAPYNAKEDLIKECKRAVDETCFYADCAVISIETMQDKICRAPEDR